MAPSWSPDGRLLAYFTTRQPTPGATPSRTLTVKDMVELERRRISSGASAAATPAR